PELGQHDRPGPDRADGGAAAGPDPEHRAVHHRAVAEPPGRRPARALELAMSTGGAAHPAAAGAVEEETVAAAGAEAPLLAVSDLRVDFHAAGRHVRAVDGLSYELRGAQTIAMSGESGCGKTVSSRALMGLLPPTARVAGSIRFDGQELVGLPERRIREYRGAAIAMVFQDPTRSLNPTMRVGDQIVEAVRAHGDERRDAARERVLELMRLVRLPAAEERFEQYPHQLSGGMRQRVMIAIAIRS